MTIARTSTLAYAEDSLASFLEAPSAIQIGTRSPAADKANDQGVAFALALRASGIAPEAWLPLLDLAYYPNASSMARFFLRLLTEESKRPLLDVLGAVQRVPWERIGRNAKTAQALFEVFKGAKEQGLTHLHQEAAQRLAEAAQDAAGWSTNDLKDLNTYLNSLPTSFRPAVQTRIDSLRQRDRVRRVIDWVSFGIVAHIGLWIALAFAYPHLRVVQAVFFWNPQVRKIVGLGYAVPLLLLVPPLRRRLVAPFAQTLLADARLDAFEAASYFDSSSVRLLMGDRGEGKRERLVDAIPEVRGHIVLEGASGLGKTQALRVLAARAERALVFLPARRIVEAGGPLQAIQAKMQGWARDPSFICSLLHVNALDLAIDGLNEVNADARAKVVGFVEDLPKANIILTTQPIAWEPPQAGATRRFELQPLNTDQIEEFLLSRELHLEEAKVDGEGYQQTCKAFLADVLSTGLSAEERSQNLVVLSNPMDLTFIAELIAAGERPSLTRLVEQQYERAAEWFRSTYQRPFPLTEVAEQAFQLRLQDNNRLKAEAAVLDVLVRFKLALRRENMDNPGAYEYHFRHDKIMELFITTHLLPPTSRLTRDDRVGDPRFSGVFVELAGKLSIGHAWSLGKRIADAADRTGEHWVSSAYMRRLLARSDIPRDMVQLVSM
jgi:hypothetical protein